MPQSRAAPAAAQSVANGGREQSNLSGPLYNSLANQPTSLADQLGAYQHAAQLDASKSIPNGGPTVPILGTGAGLEGVGAGAGLEQGPSPRTMFEPLQAIVIDNGSAVLRAGFAGETFPRIVMPNLVGRRVDTCGVGGRVGNGRTSGLYQGKRSGAVWNESSNGEDDEEKPVYIGAQALEPVRRGVMSIKYPVQNGVIKNWDDMEEYAFFSRIDSNQVNSEH